jgi:hypothetical protein
LLLEPSDGERERLLDGLVDARHVFDTLRRQSIAARHSSLSRLCLAFCVEALCGCTAASLHRTILLLNALLCLASC